MAQDLEKVRAQDVADELRRKRSQIARTVTLENEKPLALETKHIQKEKLMIHFLVHDAADNVGVAVVDLEPGTECIGRILADNSTLRTRAEQSIPLGHKLALKDFAIGDTAIKYGCEIGRIVQPVRAGQHVHTQNLKTKRWA